MSAKLAFADFRSAFDRKVDEYNINWKTLGFYSPEHRIYPFGTDTKVISTVFETLAAPLIKEIAEEHGYTVEGSEQTIYPDFTLVPENGTPPLIAIDVKTTYRKFGAKGKLKPFRYTLGSFTSFLRTPGAKKNIKYPYAEYGDHWTIGFLYTRTTGVAAKVYYGADEVGELDCPYHDVEYFVQEKYKITGITPASGNTTNIGSFPTANIQDLRDGLGPFASHGKAMCDQFWRNYAKKKAERLYNDLDEFLVWFGSQNEEPS